MQLLMGTQNTSSNTYFDSCWDAEFPVESRERIFLCICSVPPFAMATFGLGKRYSCTYCTLPWRQWLLEAKLHTSLVTEVARSQASLGRESLEDPKRFEIEGGSYPGPSHSGLHNDRADTLALGIVKTNNPRIAFSPR